MHIQYFSRFIITLLLICSFSFWAQAQKLEYVQGQFIVQLDTHADVATFIRDFNNRYDYKLELEERVSPVLNVYTVNFDFTKQREGQVLRDLWMHPKVELAQRNHFVNLRQNIPDDPEFPNQWQYVNNGQDGGVVGADIDMPEAWEYATGGVTADGDTIVACIIDDGIDNDHNDIFPNLFINHAEIPDNGIDDDNNGFVDDYRGWDTGSDSDAVYDGGGHGTPVTGIIGAKGNNGFGVAGVNWDVKLMIVQGGTGVESEVLEAYSYPLAFRRKYNQTDGAEGAFVVSTNASWGIDFGQPENAPLWCAFYDTLGLEGIISCGATINGNQDVDVIGDLPTACSSDYLISVTNMNRTDTKVTGAGYGAETIDLGAFGQQTWTVSSGGGFGGFGGTSGATPHVTGTVALAYSLPCSGLMDLAKSDPGQAALLVRQAIFDGVDPNASLEGITTTGGRLNVNNTLELILGQYCGACPAPFAVQSVVDNGSINLSWEVSDTVSTTDFRYRVVGDPDWIEMLDVGTSTVIMDVELCVDVEYQLRNSCTNSEGDWGLTKVITSFGCCENPDDLVAVANGTSVDVMWSSVEAAESYNLRYKDVNAADWIVESTVDTFLLLENLMNCTSYEFQVQTVCIVASPAYSSSVIAFTAECDDPCTELPYCDVDGLNASEEYIALVSLESIENDSIGEMGFQDFTAGGPTTDLMVGGSYLFTVAPGYVGTIYDESFGVWIDMDQDGEFEDNEKILEVDEITEEYTQQVDLPESIPEGNTRMRVAMRYQVQPESCTPENFQAFGQVEDYCVNIVSFACTSVSSIDTSYTQNTEIGILVALNLNVDAAFLSYRKVGDTDWVEEQVSSEEMIVSGLEACSEYEFRTRTQCGNDFTDYTTPILVETQCIIATVEEDNSVAIYPNPFSDAITISISGGNGLSSKSSYEIYNQWGSIVKSALLEGGSKVVVSTQSLVAGVYFIRIMDENETIVYRKIVKM